MRRFQPVQEDPNSEFVFVDIYIMLGDADGSIKGKAILQRDEWNKEVELFEEFESKQPHGQSVAGEDEHFGEYEVSLNCWVVKSCSADEKAILEKFIGKDYGFMLPSEFIE